MARRGSNVQTQAPEAEVTNAVEETEELQTEATPEESTDEATEEVTEEATEEVTPPPTTEADLSGFQAAVEAAIETMDESTGELPEAEISKVNEQYRAIDGIKGKNQARNWVDEKMKEAIMPPQTNIVLARAYVVIKEKLSAGTSSAPKAPSDPTEAFVQKVVALNLALGQVTANVPEGVSEEWAAKADALQEELEPQVKLYADWKASDDEDAEAPEVSSVVRQAFKLSQGKTPGGSGRVSGGPRRDIEKHLVHVFDALEVGDFLTVNEIAKTASEEYGDDRPSAGAVSARLFPKGKDSYDANGIRATAEEGKSRGATKVA